MKKTNIYDFLHLLSLIKIRPNMDFGGKLTFVHIWHKTYSFFSFHVKESGEKFILINQTNKLKTHHGFHSFLCFT